MAKLTIAGAEHEVPDALAPVLTQLQADNAKLLQDSKAAIESLNAKAAEAEAKAKAEAEAKTKSEIAAAAKAGDFEKANQLANARVTTLAESFRDEYLARAVEAHPGLRKATDPAERKALVDDIVAGVRAGVSFDVDKRQLVTADGKPLDLKASLDSYLAPRPHLRDASVPPGSGAGDKQLPAAGGLKRSSMPLEAKTEYIAKHGQAAYLALPW